MPIKKNKESLKILFLITPFSKNLTSYKKDNITFILKNLYVKTFLTFFRHFFQNMENPPLSVYGRSPAKEGDLSLYFFQFQSHPGLKLAAHLVNQF